MDITINLNAGELAEAINNLAGALGANKNCSCNNQIDEPKEEVKAEVKLKKAPTKQKTQKEEPKEIEEPVETEEVEIPTKEDEISEASFDEVKAKMVELTRNGKKDEVKELIKSFGASSLSEIPKEKYSELLSKAEDL